MPRLWKDDVMSRYSKTSIVFPRIASRDGPARTIDKADFIDFNRTDETPYTNSLATGFSDETTVMQPNKRSMISLIAPIPATVQSRSSQRFSSNYNRPDSKTLSLINRRRR